MADFWHGEIPTIHRLRAGRAEALAAELQPGTGARKVSLLLPCHARDLSAAAFQEMLPSLRAMTWLDRLVIGLDAGTVEDAHFANECLADFPQRTTVLRWDGPERDAVSGKGRNVWRSFGWLLDQPDTEVIALHDCDIAPYDPEALLRLVTPVARPEYGFRFAKGYYARFSDRLHGRLTRLLFLPLVAALEEMFPDQARWRQLGAWRYPLAGEMALDARLARQLPIHPRWGLETGVLLEIRRLLAPHEFCQVDLCERYDHRHQPLTAQTDKPCLVEAADDIISMLVGAAGSLLDEGGISASYERHATIARERSSHVARLNGLDYEASDEEQTVACFLDRIQGLRAQPVPTCLLPAWESVRAEGSTLHSPILTS